MPTDDQQILVTGQAAAPAFIRIPGNGQIKPKAANAIFDGTNAAGAFMPAIEIVSDAGIVVARVAASTVTAGSSAEVTWAPFLEQPQQAAAVASAEYALGYTDYLIGPNSQGQAVNAGAHAVGFFVSALTTNVAVMSWSTAITQYDTLTLHAKGVYLMFFQTLRNTATGDRSSIMISASQKDIPHLPFLCATNPFGFDQIGQTTYQDYTVTHVTAGSASFNVQHTNNTAFNDAVDKQWLSVIYMPTS